MKTLILFLSLNLLAVAAEQQREKLPDWAAVFPNATLWNQSKLDGIETYAYATDAAFGELKARLQEQLGAAWKEVPVSPELAKDLEKDDRKTASFTTPAFPRLTIGVAHGRQNILGKTAMFVVTILKPKGSP